MRKGVQPYLEADLRDVLLQQDKGIPHLANE